MLSEVFHFMMKYLAFIVDSTSLCLKQSSKNNKKMNVNNWVLVLNLSDLRNI